MIKPAFFISEYSNGYSSEKAAKLLSKGSITEYSSFVKATTASQTFVYWLLELVIQTNTSKNIGKCAIT